jgi:hypothetical protein
MKDEGVRFNRINRPNRIGLIAAIFAPLYCPTLDLLRWRALSEGNCHFFDW